MATCSPKSRSKLNSPVYIAGISLLAAVVLITAAVNLSANLSRDRYAQMIGDFLGCPVSLNRIYFIPFNVFIITDLRSKDQINSRPLYAADSITLRFDAGRLLREKKFVPSYLGVKKGCWNTERDISSDWSGDLSSMFSGSSAMMPLKAALQDSEVIILQESGARTSFQVELQFQTTGQGVLSAQGIISPGPGASPDSSSCAFRVSALLSETGCQIRNIEVRTNGLYAKLWGEGRGNEIYLNGMVSGNNRLWNFHSRRSVWRRAKEKMKSFCFWRRDSSPSIVGGEPCGLQIFDLECCLRILPRRIDLSYARYTLNGVPFLVKGFLLSADCPELEMSCSSYPEQTGPARRNNSDAFDIMIKGAFGEGGFDGEISSESVRRTHKGYVPQQIKADLERLRLSYPQKGVAEISCERSLVSYHNRKDSYAMELTDICLALTASRSSTALKFRSALYGGSLEGEGTVDMAVFPARYYVKLSARDIQPELIDIFSPYAAFSSGTAHGQVVARNTPGFELSGNVEIDEGVLHDTEFFSWLAKFCRIPSLSSVPFSRFSAHFMVTPDASSIDEIKLSSAWLGLDGYFHLYQSGLVSGKVSLGFSRDLLANSAKFKSLVRLLGDDVSAARFEFKLSGLCEAMNFKWLSSDFKQKLQDLLPRGMEKSIEKKIEAVVLAISDQ